MPQCHDTLRNLALLAIMTRGLRSLSAWSSRNAFRNAIRNAFRKAIYNVFHEAIALWHTMCCIVGLMRTPRPPRPPHCATCILALPMVLFSLLWTTSAFAQTVSISEGGIKRSNGFRKQSENPMWISKADCLADDEYTFPLTVSNYGGYQLEVWVGSAGDDCTSGEARRGTTAVCWQVWKGVPTNTGFSVVVRSQDIVSRRKASDGVVTGPGSGTAADCEWKEATTAPVEVALYFMFVSAGSDQHAGGVYWTTKFDLAGPTPPTNVKAGIGNTSIIVKWDATTDTDKAGYRFFCDPAPKSEPKQVIMRPYDLDASLDAFLDVDSDEDAPVEADDSGSDSGSDANVDTGPESEGGPPTNAGGSGGGSNSDGSCTSSVLVPGKEPDPAYECGTGTSTTGSVTGLTNGAQYVVGVASVDSVGNVGKLSNLACATPSQVDDFFTVYRDAGGKAGGGFCSLSNVGAKTGLAGIAGSALFAFASLGAVIRWRRKR